MSLEYPGDRKSNQVGELESVGRCDIFGTLRGHAPVVSVGQQSDYSERPASNISQAGAV